MRKRKSTARVKIVNAALKRTCKHGINFIVEHRNCSEEALIAYDIQFFTKQLIKTMNSIRDERATHKRNIQPQEDLFNPLLFRHMIFQRNYHIENRVIPQVITVIAFDTFYKLHPYICLKYNANNDTIRKNPE